MCLAVAGPCKLIEGRDSDILNATDDQWITMTHTNWPEVSNMTNKHCKQVHPPEGQVRHHVTVEDCMLLCKASPTCMVLSHSDVTNTCIMAPYCIQEEDE